MTKQEEQIAELNTTVKTRIGVSKIHGVGVIALRDIKVGEKCYCIPVKQGLKWYSVPWGSLNKLFPEVKQLIVDQWPSIINGSLFLSPNYTAWPILFMNHSSNPNFDQFTDLALEDIKKGEELVEDYRKMTNWKEVCPWADDFVFAEFESKKKRWYNRLV